MTPMGLWARRAATAEAAILSRHLRPLPDQENAQLGVARWPATRRQEQFGDIWWHFWWQAHLVDCLVDAQGRSPDPQRLIVIGELLRGIRLRNGSWINEYYDDIAWLGLAMERLGRLTGRQSEGLDEIVTRLHQGWSSDAGGGLWWCEDKDVKNAPINGPAAILFSRLGDTTTSMSLAQWLEDHLVDPVTGLVWDGLHVNSDGSAGRIDRWLFTYCQGVYLGACTELALSTRDSIWAERAERTIRAVARDMANDHGVLPGHGGHDGGLFTGILLRYLAQAAIRLPGSGTARREAIRLVFCSAAAAWHSSCHLTSGPLFGPDWCRPAQPPLRAEPHHPDYRGNADTDTVEWDLSVQLGGWMALEAAALLERAA